MKLPTRAEWQLLALVVLLAWPMQLHIKHIPGADPWAIPGFAMLVYLAWPLASVALIYAPRKRLAAIWLVAATVLTLWLGISGTWNTWRGELFVVGAIGVVTALIAAVRGGLKPAEFGLGPGEWRRWGPITALGMGVAVVLVQVGSLLSPELVGFYPVYGPARRSAGLFVGWELGMAAYMICWESLFRGTLLYGARRTLTATGAVVLQAVPFFLLHEAKPELEMASSILGGIVLGYFCLWARSCWPAAILHTTLYTTMELTGAWHRGFLSAG